MNNKRQSFREFVAREDASDAAADRELAKNPNMLTQGLPPQDQEKMRKAIAAKQMNPNASMDAALRAAQIRAKLQQKTAVPGQVQPGQPGQMQPPR